MKKHAGAGIGAGVLVLSALLAGCGGDDGGSDDKGGKDENGGLSAEEFSQLEWPELREMVNKDMESLESAHVDMTIKQSSNEINADIAMSTTGSCEGDLAVNGAGLELLQADDQTWFRAEPEFWEQNSPDGADQIIEAVGDKWIVDPGEYAQFCDLEAFLDNLISDESTGENHEISEPKELDGEQVVEITYETDGNPVTAWVRAEGKHYIVKLERTGEESGTVEFSDYDEPVETEAPAEDEVVDLSELG